MSGSEAPPLLRCKGVTATFGSLVAVDHMDLTASEGETIGIGGPNGAGKTTFLDLVSGLLPLADGEIVFDGETVGGRPPHRICHMGIARTFQLNAGFEALTVLENVLAATVFGARTNTSRGLFYSRPDLERAEALLEEFDLADKAGALVANVTVLDRKKLMVATALATEPRLLLLDEPVGGLTPHEIDAFVDLIATLKGRGLTIIFIEHVMRFLTAVATRAVIMHHGATIYDGDPQGIAHDGAVTEIYLGRSAEGMREAAARPS
ncbi:MAG: ABC transporter ATP-binding protein [Hyphomicrobiales bacterium]